MTQQTTDLSDLSALGAALQAAAGRTGEQTKIKDAILDRFGKLDPDAAKALLKDERIQRLLEEISDEKAQAAEDLPGTIKPGFIGGAKINGFTKRDWTEADLANCRDGAGKLVTFVPVETIPVFWNGLRRQLIADEEITVEQCFKDVYDEHRRANKLAGEHAAFLFRKRDRLTDPSIVTAEGARARGLAETGWYVPGGGGIIPAAATPAPADSAAAGTEEGAA